MPGRFSRVLLVYKKSAWELHASGRRIEARLARLLREAHVENSLAIAAVKRALGERRISWRATSRADLHPRGVRNHEPDLVISVGGDGTFLEASHQVRRGAILGVNSSPAHSVGFFCAGTREDVGQLLDRALSGRLGETPLHRLEISLRGTRLPYLALNDVLLTHQNPAATSRYDLYDPARGLREIHRSSGLWVATAAGSTAGIRAAGGRLLPVGSDRFQYAVRELYMAPGEPLSRLSRGVLSRGMTLKVTCRMVGGALFLDGPRHRYSLRLGDQVAVRISSAPLRVLGFRGR